MKDRHQREGTGHDQTRGYQCMGVDEQLEEKDGEQGEAQTDSGEQRVY